MRRLTPVVQRQKQIAIAMAVSIPLAILTMLLTMGTRPDLAQAIRFPMFWMKVLFPAAVACAGFATLARLARLGVSARAGKWAGMLPILVSWLMAIVAYAGAPASVHAAMVWGQSWRTCTLSVLLISVPVFAAAFLALRRLAPTQLAPAGACAGMMAIWHVAGIATAAGIGAALGPRLLRW